MSITCGRGHQHPSVSDVRACYAAPPTRPAPVARPSSGPARTERHVVFTESEPTDKQLATIERLGGVLPDGCTRGQASSIIGKLYEKKEKRVSTPTPAPRADGPQYLPSFARDFPFPSQLIYALIEGERSESRFAVSRSASDADDLAFVRVSLIKAYKSGKRRRFQGCVRIQTQHSDDLIDRFIVDVNGKYTAESSTMSAATMAGYLASIIVDPRGAAAKYGRALNQCCVCGKTLTDERSRWYGIGPDCEQRWSEIIVESDDARGPFVPSALKVSN